MDFIIDAIVEWLKGLLVDGIMGNLDGLFNNVNQSVGEIATQVGTTPADWNAGVFSMIRQISETAILPIAGVILTFVMTYELIQMLIDRNNLHDVDTWMFFKWVFKTFVAVMILTNTFNIVLAVFDVSQHVIQQSAGIIQNGTEITTDVMDSLRTELEAMELGPLFGLWLQSFLIQLTMIALNIVIFVIVYGRMIEIYLLTSLAPIPFATVPNRETGHMGQNYFRSLFAVGFQGLLILVCVAIYAVLIQSIATDGDPEYRHRRRPHWGDLGLCGLYGASVFYPVQNGQPCKIHLRLPLRDFGPCWPEAERRRYAPALQTGCGWTAAPGYLRKAPRGIF